MNPFTAIDASIGFEVSDGGSEEWTFNCSPWQALADNPSTDCLIKCNMIISNRLFDKRSQNTLPIKLALLSFNSSSSWWKLGAGLDCLIAATASGAVPVKLLGAVTVNGEVPTWRGSADSEDTTAPSTGVVDRVFELLGLDKEKGD